MSLLATQREAVVSSGIISRAALPPFLPAPGNRSPPECIVKVAAFSFPKIHRGVGHGMAGRCGKLARQGGDECGPGLGPLLFARVASLALTRWAETICWFSLACTRNPREVEYGLRESLTSWWGYFAPEMAMH
jgi:hypothetical protein